ncbi:MAG: nitrite/sulfite reductase [Anaerolineae bacterium]|nr:nitrite/sulfite reductase [Anaerolineae bacterium]
MTETTWKDLLAARIPDVWLSDIDIFENQLELRQQNRIPEKVFAETRLRQGVYGQRYDNGQRHDGITTRPLNFPEGTKGPDTIWDAPGMQRIKVPFGGLSAEQLDVMAQIADEYADSILHITTRQDIQFHYVHIEDTPDLMRRLGAVGITTKEACGNSVRNLTACPLAGVCRTQTFDVTPYTKAMADFLLGHDDIQDFGRKFKIAFSGCEHEACGLVNMHDFGLLARIQEVDGVPTRGFRIYVGGGLGTIPHNAKVLYDFVTEDQILPVVQAVSRVFARLGEKQNRNKARIKFLVADLGIEEFTRLVDEELPTMPHDDRWTAFLTDLPDYEEKPLKTAVSLNGATLSPHYLAWAETNTYAQRQDGYYTVTVNLPLGDLSSDQAFKLADIARHYVGDNIRTTVEQNIVLRWVSEADLPAVYEALTAIGLGAAGAGTIVDITSCPGTDTCKLGIASSRGLAGELRTQLTAKIDSLPAPVKELRIKVSGCFNSCGQHHVADIGFFGNSRRRDSRTVPHFQVVLGGRWRDNGGSYGLAIGAVPSKAIPDVLEAITTRYVAEREDTEIFQDWVTRLGKKEIRTLIQPFQTVPAYLENRSFYTDWGDPREFSIGDIGVGECAGEIVSLFSFEIAKAEGQHFEAMIALDEGDYGLANQLANNAMLLGARALVRNQFLDVGDDPERIISEFRSRYYDTKLFFDPFAKGKFAEYLFDRYENPPAVVNADTASQAIQEAQLFIEAAHACDAKLAAQAQV